MSDYYDKIIKLLMLSTSENDPEALSAIRIANSLLKKNCLDWSSFFRETRNASPKTSRSTKNRSTRTEATGDIASLISYIKEYAWPGFDFEFVASVEQQFENTAWLTYAQIKGLKKVFETVQKYQQRGK